ncbi:SLC9A3R2 [Cordylochernes scorpioides]|uniref:SLC9A3R2 n=1 Tax=Cordylochernes scorpioides TaxID=51811 RepID=A0ABY6KPN0_9ARAC|nr:SLC9A3R2 [Cordylochernes scorpioides]
MANESLPAGAPSPRLCHLVKWPDHDEYGFNLHAEKAKLGQFIGTVDTGSPAYYAGLLEGDRIIEVNDVNISNENHRQVVERIKAIANETRLLVVDKQTDEWYKERKLIVKGTQKNVSYKKNPTERPEANNYTANNVKENGDSQKSNSSRPGTYMVTRCTYPSASVAVAMEPIFAVGKAVNIRLTP